MNGNTTDSVLALSNGRILTDRGIEEGLAVLVQAGRIAAVVSEHRNALLDPAIGEDAAVDQGQDAVGRIAVHTVSVTLFRCGGTSGLCPRRSANALMAR